MIEQKGRVGCLQRDVRAIKGQLDRLELRDKENKFGDKENRPAGQLLCPLEQDMIKFAPKSDDF